MNYRKLLLIVGGIGCYAQYYFTESEKFYIASVVFLVGFIVYDGILSYFKQFEE